MIAWETAKAVVAVAAFYAMYRYFDQPDWRYETDRENDHPVASQAEITSRVYFDIAIDDQPMGRIVMGLHGNVVPKTVKNFETLCRGDHPRMGNTDMTYQGSVFHRIIPNFMIQGGAKPGRSIYGTIYYDGRFPDENFQVKPNLAVLFRQLIGANMIF